MWTDSPCREGMSASELVLLFQSVSPEGGFPSPSMSPLSSFEGRTSSQREAGYVQKCDCIALLAFLPTMISNKTFH